MANIITILRIICSIFILFYLPFSIEFYILYLLAGLTDMIDGTVARKIINVISGFVVHNKFVVEHTIMNKFTGLLLFILPLTLTIVDLKYTSIVVCLFATFAAIQEGHLIRTE